MHEKCFKFNFFANFRKLQKKLPICKKRYAKILNVARSVVTRVEKNQKRRNRIFFGLDLEEQSVGLLYFQNFLLPATGFLPTDSSLYSLADTPLCPLTRTYAHWPPLCLSSYHVQAKSNMKRNPKKNENRVIML